MTKHPFIQKTGALLALVGLFMFSGVVFFQLQTAFGWTNPASSPPGGAGVLSAVNGNVEINTGNTSNGAAPALKITPQTVGSTVQTGIDVMGSKITGLTAPTNDSDAVNLGYLQEYVSAEGTGGGGGSLVLYYRTISNSPPPIPTTCPSGWTQVGAEGYGPHYLALFAHDWLQNGTGGTGGGFAPGVTPPTPNGSNGASYILRSVAIGSDSVCSQDPDSIVYFSNIYNNALTSGYTSMKAQACFTNQSTGVTECNRCLVCQK